MLVKRLTYLSSIFNRFPVIQAGSLKIRHFSTFFAHFDLPCVRPGTIALNFTWVEREFSACQTPRSMYPYLQPVLRYSKLLVENCDIFTPHLCLAVRMG